MMTRFLVTGGAGFIGSNIVRRLVSEGRNVTVLDNFSTGHRTNLSGIEDDIRLVNGDLRDLAAVQTAVQGADYVLHQAALPSVQRSVDDPVESNANNVDGTLNLLVAARDAKVKALVYAASSSAYGDTPTLPKREEMPPNPLSPYAITKLVGEHYCTAFAKLYGLNTVSLRYFNVFGPRQDPASQYAAVIPLFATALLQGGVPTVFGDGHQSRDFTFVDNVVDANLAACLAAEQVAGQVFNVACGERYSLNQLLDLLREIIGNDTQARYEDPRPGDVKHSLADITKAREQLGFEPQISFRQGLEVTVEWFRELI